MSCTEPGVRPVCKSIWLACALAFAACTPLPGVKSARDRMARAQHGLAVGFELDGHPSRETGIDLAPVSYRPSLQYTYLFLAPERRLHFALGGEISASTAHEQYLGKDLQVALSQFWGGAFAEMRWIPRANMSAIHLRLRASGMGNRLTVNDNVSHSSDSDWAANFELAPLVGLRIGSLVLLETGMLVVMPHNYFHIEQDDVKDRFPDPRVQFTWIVRAAVEFRFGE
jgi:hypothetical protein